MVNFEYIDDDLGFLPKKKNFNLVKASTGKDVGVK